MHKHIPCHLHVLMLKHAALWPCDMEFRQHKSYFYSLLKVSELYEDLKKRVSHFNMHVAEETESLDYTSTHKQKFILQVSFCKIWRGIDFPGSMLYTTTIITVKYLWIYLNIPLKMTPLFVLDCHCWCLLPQLLCPGGHGWRLGFQRILWLQPYDDCDGITFGAEWNYNWN